RHLGGNLPILELPTDFERPGILDFKGKRLMFNRGPEFSAGVKALARSEKVTVTMTLLAVYILLLHKLTGHEDILVGMPADIREHEDFEHTFGMFANTLVVRGLPSKNTTFRDFLKKIKTACLNAYANKTYPFELLVDKLDHTVDMGRNPIINVAMVYEIAGQLRFQLPGRTCTVRSIDSNAVPFDLVFEFFQQSETLGMKINYRTSLFNEETIRMWERYFERLMKNAIDDASLPISRLEMMTMEEKALFLSKVNDTATDFPSDKTMYELFYDHVDRAPGSIALLASPDLAKNRGAVDGHRSKKMTGDRPENSVSVTYKELDGQAGRIAAFLLENGVRVGDVVALKINRSLEMYAAILGILRVGAAYMPVSPTFPIPRITYMLNDSRAQILLSGVTEPKSPAGNAKVMDIHSILQKELPADAENFAAVHGAGKPDNLAYIIYTSGSTGMPKGTMVSHKNAVRVVKNTNYMEIFPEDRVLGLSDYAFDGSVFDIFGALLNGAVLVPVNKEDGTSAEKLAGVIENFGITVFFVTTALFNALTDLGAGRFKTVRKIMFGGERASTVQVSKALETLGKDRLLHVYGPTETAVYATYRPINTLAENAGNVPIGKPISNTTVYILDENLKPVPTGIAGELCVGGEGVCRGYLNNTELTAEKFINLSGQCFPSQGRIYRTGDLTRMLPNGDIEFLGRNDRQVKIRGFR
ncbi:MAG: amino acid adenylation domain-containing protein, partial [bacterium]|nr:amino acid adenylation domain-containing protein [bacterium]